MVKPEKSAVGSKMLDGACEMDPPFRRGIDILKDAEKVLVEVVVAVEMD
jgi:hypothetical protein